MRNLLRCVFIVLVVLIAASCTQYRFIPVFPPADEPIEPVGPQDSEGHWNSPEAVVDVFKNESTYSANVKQGEKGVILKPSTDYPTTGPATYFGSAERNYRWDGTESSISFNLDLSGLGNGQATTWVLSFNKLTDGTKYGFADEIRFGIFRDSSGVLHVNKLSGINHNNIEADIVAIEGEGSKTITGNDIKASFSMSYDKSSKTLSYSMNIAGAVFTGTHVETEDIVGFRSLWNASLSADSAVELYQLGID